MRKIAAALTMMIASVASAKDLRVGMELAYPPFEMTDDADKPAGVSVEIAQALAKSLNRPLKIENIAFEGLIPALKTGKIDCIISSMTATPERARSVDFSDPYLSTGLALLVSAKSTVKDLKDLNQKGRTVVVKQGTTGHQFAVESIKNAKVTVLHKESSAVLEVAQGKADAFIYDQMSVYQNWKKNPQYTRAELKPIRQESWAIAVAKGQGALKKDINAFLKKYKADKGFETLGDKYLAEPKKAFKELGVPFYF